MATNPEVSSNLENSELLQLKKELSSLYKEVKEGVEPSVTKGPEKLKNGKILFDYKKDNQEWEIITEKDGDTYKVRIKKRINGEWHTQKFGDSETYNFIAKDKQSFNEKLGYALDKKIGSKRDKLPKTGGKVFDMLNESNGKINDYQENNEKPKKISKEVMKRFDPEGHGYFRYKKGSLWNCISLLFGQEGVYLEDELEDEGVVTKLETKLESCLLKYDKQEITPQMIDSIIYDLCNFKFVGKDSAGNAYTYTITYFTLSNSVFYGRDSFVEKILVYVDYLQPRTVNKVMELSETIRCGYDDENSLRKFYNKLDSNHKIIYYDKLFQLDGRTGWSDRLTNQYLYDDLGDYIFEKPLSSNTYNKLKKFLGDVNDDGNGILKSRTSSKKIIDQLKDKGQINETQAKELYRVSGIKY